MITIDEYRFKDFNISDKAIWLVGRWPAPRLETRYKNFFLPKSQIAIKGDKVFIPRWLVDSFKYENSLDCYKYNFPTRINSYYVTNSDWELFLSTYPFHTCEEYEK